VTKPTFQNLVDGYTAQGNIQALLNMRAQIMDLWANQRRLTFSDALIERLYNDQIDTIDTAITRLSIRVVK
jgi:hypothetical protein